MIFGALSIVMFYPFTAYTWRFVAAIFLSKMNKIEWLYRLLLVLRPVAALSHLLFSCALHVNAFLFFIFLNWYISVLFTWTLINLTTIQKSFHLLFFWTICYIIIQNLCQLNLHCKHFFCILRYVYLLWNMVFANIVVETQFNRVFNLTIHHDFKKNFIDFIRTIRCNKVFIITCKLFEVDHSCEMFFKELNLTEKGLVRCMSYWSFKLILLTYLFKYLRFAHLDAEYTRLVGQYV
mgnify:CR=1 FL=1